MASESCNKLVHKTQGLTIVASEAYCHAFVMAVLMIQKNATGPFSAFVFDAV
ncbi:hypothetical protein T01_13141 [Trichinella spiralis]|uniref:Uncharacterized protein n=1 Tax=Trichinella spiralis TaxID=6334 RepID=A0A0V1BUC8_TRISP|nr:hypothetical protein T01_13141 [Trichinella spiralis]